MPSIGNARNVIAYEMGQGRFSGRVDNHNADKNIIEKAWTYGNDIAGAFTWGEMGSPEPAFFLGSYDLEWAFKGMDETGTPIIEFHLTNATTQNSGAPNPMKLIHYSNGGMAGDGSDAKPGERWLQQDVTWREPIKIFIPPPPMPMCCPTPSPQVLGTPNPTPGPQPS